MAKLVMCPECGTKNEKENTIQHNKRYYCISCFDGLEKRKKEREYLLAYICSLYGLDIKNKVDGRILKDLKDLNEEGYSYKDIYLTLKYCSEIKKLTFEVKFALGCVRYYRGECLAYLDKVNNITNKSSDLKPLQVQKVVATRQKYRPSFTNSLINIDTL